MYVFVHLYLHLYLYVYMCVCVCMYVLYLRPCLWQFCCPAVIGKVKFLKSQLCIRCIWHT